MQALTIGKGRMKITIDVSRRWKDDYIAGRLVLTTPSKKMTAKEALTRFRRSVGQWLANTEVGKAAWEDSHRDFNCGDFRENDVAKDPEFRRFLVANGLTSAQVERFEAEDCGAEWDDVMEPEGD